VFQLRGSRKAVSQWNVVHRFKYKYTDEKFTNVNIIEQRSLYVTLCISERKFFVV